MNTANEKHRRQRPRDANRHFGYRQGRTKTDRRMERFKDEISANNREIERP